MLVSHKLHMLCVCPYCSRLFVLCHKLHTYFLCQAWAGKEFARGDIHSKILNWETFYPCLDGLILGKIWKTHWESLFFIWEKFVTFCEILMWFLWQNLLLGKFGIGEFECQFLKFLLGNPVGNFPAQVSWENFVCHVGSVSWKKIFLVGKLVWNIGEIFENFNLGKLLLGILLNLLKIPSWEHLVKFGKISILENFLKFGIFYLGKECFCPCLLNKTLKILLGKFFAMLTMFDLGVFCLEKIYLKFYLGKLCFPRSNMVDWLTDNFMGE